MTTVRCILGYSSKLRPLVPSGGPVTLSKAENWLPTSHLCCSISAARLNGDYFHLCSYESLNSGRLCNSLTTSVIFFYWRHVFTNLKGEDFKPHLKYELKSSCEYV